MITDATIKQRNIAIDIMKGLGMLLVIYDHCSIIDIEHKRMFMSFLMPMFFMVGGYLYKPNFNLWQDIKKSGKRLIFPYLVGVAIMLFFNHQLNLYGLYSLIGAAGLKHYWCKYLCDWPSVGAFWFFMAMFWCRVIFNLIFTRTERYKYPLLVLTCIVGYLLLRYVIRLPLGISEGLSMMMFYLIGHLFSVYSKNKATWTLRNQKICKIVFIFVLCIGLILWIWSIKNSEVYSSGGIYEHHLINILGACCATYIYYWICKLIGTYLNYTTKLLVFAGYGSLFILWIHKISRHCIFTGPTILGFAPETITNTYIAINLLAQYAFCLLSLLLVKQSKHLSSFFGIYSH